MKLARRAFLHLTAAGAALPVLSRAAFALDYPTRPVHMIVDLPPGLAPDIMARLIAPQLSARLGQSFVVENRPGAGGNIGADAVAKSPPDGYTLLVMISGNAASAALYPSLDFNFVRDIAPIAFLGYTPFVMVVNPSLPAKTLPAFIAYAKANPNKIDWASPGVGTAPHLAGELFQMMTGVKLVHVPYRTSYMPDLLGDHVQIAFVSSAPVLGYIRSGKLRALAVTTTKRLDVLPDVPAMAENVPGYEGSGWAGVGAPKGTPAGIVNKLNQNINAALADPGLKTRLSDLGVETQPMTAGAFGKLIADAAEKWTKVIKFANIKAH